MTQHINQIDMKRDNENTANWTTKIAGCFGSDDLEFAMHANDEQRALEMFRTAFSEGASINDVLTAIKDRVRSKNGDAAHVKKQLDRALNLKLWL